MIRPMAMSASESAASGSIRYDRPSSNMAWISRAPACISDKIVVVVVGRESDESVTFTLERVRRGSGLVHVSCTER